MTPLMWWFVAAVAAWFVLAVIDSNSKRHRRRSRDWKGRR